jgi:hypothetical protein
MPSRGQVQARTRSGRAVKGKAPSLGSVWPSVKALDAGLAGDAAAKAFAEVLRRTWAARARPGLGYLTHSGLGRWRRPWAHPPPVPGPVEVRLTHVDRPG